MGKLRTASSLTSPPNAVYYSGVWRKARAYRVDMARKQWCDLSHQHFDWDGAGNASWHDRRRHLSLLLHAFRRVQKELASYEGQYQVFALVTPTDSVSDAVYVHTPNPNGTPFPAEPTGEPVTSLPPLLAGRIDTTRYQVFRATDGAASAYAIMPRAALGFRP